MMWHLWITRVTCKYSIYWIVLVLVLFAEGLLLVIPLKHSALLEALLKKLQGSLLQITTKLNIGCLKWIPLICRLITCSNESLSAKNLDKILSLLPVWGCALQIPHWKLIQRLFFFPYSYSFRKNTVIIHLINWWCCYPGRKCSSLYNQSLKVSKAFVQTWGL